MSRFYESLTGWGTLIGSTLTALSMASALIVFAVRMEGGIAKLQGDVSHCTVRR